MLKRFIEFRDNLTYKQLSKILWVVGIIIAIAYVAHLILTEAWKEGYPWGKDMPFPMAVITALFLLELSILFVIWLVLDGIEKSTIHESEQAKRRASEKLKEDEATEVYFAPHGIIGDLEEFLKAPYEIFGLTYLAHREGDKIIVRLMQGEKELRKETIGNGSFFEANFKFPKTEEKD